MTPEQKAALLRKRGVQIQTLPSGALRLSNRANIIMVDSMRNIFPDDIETFGKLRRHQAPKVGGAI